MPVPTDDQIAADASYLPDDYRVLVAADRFDEDAPDQKAMKEYAGQRIRMPSAELIWPDRKNLAWHRERKFVA